jgi:hypothetical protein
MRLLLTTNIPNKEKIEKLGIYRIVDTTKNGNY